LIAIVWGEFNSPGKEIPDIKWEPGDWDNFVRSHGGIAMQYTIVFQGPVDPAKTATIGSTGSLTAQAALYNMWKRDFYNWVYLYVRTAMDEDPTNLPYSGEDISNSPDIIISESYIPEYQRITLVRLSSSQI
jgi:hypothetical protein